MTDTAAAQLRRILHLIPRLADGESHPIDEVARHVGVDRGVLLQDIESISDRFDAPGGFIEGLQIYLEAETISVVPNHFLRPMRLTRAELAALELGLAMLAGECPPEELPALDRARVRLRSVIGRLPSEDIAEELRSASLALAGDPAHLHRMRDAFRTRRKVRLRYRKGTDVDVSSRVICPYGIVFAGTMWYVVAYCEGSDGIRVFRLDRVERVELLDSRYEPPQDFSLDAVTRDGHAFQAAGAGTLTVWYSPRIARWIAEREGRPLEADGSLVLEHPLAELAWAVRHVLQYGPEAEVLEPAEAREAVVARLAALADD